MRAATFETDVHVQYMVPFGNLLMFRGFSCFFYGKSAEKLDFYCLNHKSQKQISNKYYHVSSRWTV